MRFEDGHQSLQNQSMVNPPVSTVSYLKCREDLDLLFIIVFSETEQIRSNKKNLFLRGRNLEMNQNQLWLAELKKQNLITQIKKIKKEFAAGIRQDHAAEGGSQATDLDSPALLPPLSSVNCTDKPQAPE